MAFRAELRHRWRSWLAIAILISVVGGLVLAAAAAGRRTEAAFPQFVAAHGFDAVVYATQPVPKVGQASRGHLGHRAGRPRQWSADVRLHPPDRPDRLRRHRRTAQGQIALQARLGPLA